MSETSDPFDGLGAWEEEVKKDVGDAYTPEEKLRLLLEHSKNVEIVVAGSLHEVLLDLYEASQLGFADEGALRKQRQQLFQEAEERLAWVKCQLLPTLAQQNGIYDQYLTDVKKPINHTVSDYERLADLEYGLIVWRLNLRRDMAATKSKDEKVALLRDAAAEGEQLIKRCVYTSFKFWSDVLDRQRMRQRQAPHAWQNPCAALNPHANLARSSPMSPQQRSPISRRRSGSFNLPPSDTPLDGTSIIALYEKFVGQVNLHIEELSQQSGVSAELDALAKEGLLGSPPTSPNKIKQRGSEE